MVVYKYNLLAIGRLSLEMPIGSQILSCQNQDESIVMWALVNPEALKEGREFICVGTGHALQRVVSSDETVKYIGTVLTKQDTFVTHIFEVRD